jgi:ketol-acid reductoisomerase
MSTASADASEEARPPIEAGDIAALRVSLIGYGEVGGIFGAALAKSGVATVTAFDVLIADASWAATARTRAWNDGVALVSNTSDAVANAALVISAVTAAATASAAEQIASRSSAPARVGRNHDANPNSRRGVSHRTLRRSDALGKSVTTSASSTP